MEDEVGERKSEKPNKKNKKNDELRRDADQEIK